MLLLFWGNFPQPAGPGQERAAETQQTQREPKSLNRVFSLTSCAFFFFSVAILKTKHYVCGQILFQVQEKKTIWPWKEKSLDGVNDLANVDSFLPHFKNKLWKNGQRAGGGLCLLPRPELGPRWAKQTDLISRKPWEPRDGRLLQNHTDSVCSVNWCLRGDFAYT